MTPLFTPGQAAEYFAPREFFTPQGVPVGPVAPCSLLRDVAVAKSGECRCLR